MLTYLPFLLLGALPRFFRRGVFLVLFHFAYPFLSYRKAVVQGNLRRVFPTLSNKALERLQREFFRELGLHLVSLLPFLRGKKEDLLSRVICENPELPQLLSREKGAVIVAASHCGPWERAFAVLPAILPHPVGLVHTPLRNGYFGELLRRIRTRLGLELIARNDFARHLDERGVKPYCYLVPADQRPSDPIRSHHVPFLGNDTPFLFGVERYAGKHDLPVVFLSVKNQEKEGLRLRFHLIPPGKVPGELTQAYAGLLEQEILLDPCRWLWTHRRWKQSNEEPIR